MHTGNRGDVYQTGIDEVLVLLRGKIFFYAQENSFQESTLPGGFAKALVDGMENTIPDAFPEELNSIRKRWLIGDTDDGKGTDMALEQVVLSVEEIFWTESAGVEIGGGCGKGCGKGNGTAPA